MNEAVDKEEVIEEEFNFTFKNGEYVEVKQEEVEQKPEYLLENGKKPIDFFENNNSDEFLEDVKPEPRENDFKIEKAFTEIGALSCKICQKRMPRKYLKWIISEDDKMLLSDIFKIEMFKEMRQTYVCVSHIQKIIDDNDGKVKFANNPIGQKLHSFITRNKKFMKGSPSRRGICKVCHILKNRSEIYEIGSKNIRIVLMIGCILRGTHSVEQAKSYVTIDPAITCYSHCKESIDMIYKHLGVRNIEEFSKCSTTAMGGLVEIAKNFDPNFTVDQFFRAFNTLFTKNRRKLPSS
ncbi:hypothetical protein B9Z55_021068 [Caenorhabditis nigoni]|uniref:Lin-15A/B-like domain-containing protein n=1 Tax=Caenorhabditis nigoni TaxID=1611254 RepID=A0A2G5TQJ1_9PELO|nr:hypothetical protein B9Z55_021068 [Caenorhabditis nigoni]